MTKILVTGGLGFLGQHVVKRLLEAERGSEIRILARSKAEIFLNELNNKRVEIQYGVDITQKDSMERHFAKADIVIHIAAMISFWRNDRERMEDVNIAGTRNVVDLCLKHEVKRLVHVSSTAAIKGSRNIHNAADETSDYDWRGKSNYDYGLSKYYAEKEVEQGVARGLDAVIANPCTIVGYGDAKFFALIRTALKNIPVCFSGGSHLLDVRDLARGIVLLTNGGKSGDRILLTGEFHSQKEILTKLAAILKTKPPVFVLPGQVLLFAIPILSITDARSRKKPNLTRTVAENGLYPSYYSSRKSREVLNWEPNYPLDDSLREAVTYYYKVNQ